MDTSEIRLPDVLASSYVDSRDVNCFHLREGLPLYLNPLPDMPIFGSCNLTANENMMPKIWTNGVTVI